MPACRRCLNSTRNRIYETVESRLSRLSICLSHRSTAATTAGGFAADGPAGKRYWSIAAGAGVQQQRRPSTALSSIVTLTADAGGRTQICSVIFVCSSILQLYFTINESQSLRKVDKKLSYRRGTARCVLSVLILPITTQQCRNYLYDKSLPNRWYEVGGLVGGNVS